MNKKANGFTKKSDHKEMFAQSQFTETLKKINQAVSLLLDFSTYSPDMCDIAGVNIFTPMFGLWLSFLLLTMFTIPPFPNHVCLLQ